MHRHASLFSPFSFLFYFSFFLISYACHHVRKRKKNLIKHESRITALGSNFISDSFKMITQGKDASGVSFSHITTTYIINSLMFDTRIPQYHLTTQDLNQLRSKQLTTNKVIINKTTIQNVAQL